MIRNKCLYKRISYVYVSAYNPLQINVKNFCFGVEASSVKVVSVVCKCTLILLCH